MELRDIEYFLSIANNKNLSKAADELFLSQSALSQFLTKLEKSIGAPLFIRDNKRLFLTDAGKVYYASAEKIMSIKEQALREISDLVRISRTTIRLGTTGVRSLQFAAYLLPLFQKQYPQCEFQIFNNDSDTTRAKISHRALDFAFITINEPDDRFHSILLKSEEIGLCIPISHPFLSELKKKNNTCDMPIDISQLSNENLVLSRSGSTLTKLCFQYFEKENFKPKKTICTWEFSSQIDTICALRMIGLVSSGYIGRAEGVVFQKVKRPIQYKLGIIYCQSMRLSQMQRDFIELVKVNRMHY
ncbi:LysR family transcriptional regulator [Faecalicatena sp. BF-R-105]|nr:LysR family transcriptional regulator [Faecalicatena sp. BF-R-105]